MSYCKFCGQEIDWIHTPGGKAVPIDPDPVFIVGDGSKDVFYLEDSRPPISGRVARKEEESVDLEVGFVPHNRTCAYWQKGMKRSGGSRNCWVTCHALSCLPASGRTAGTPGATRPAEE